MYVFGYSIQSVLFFLGFIGAANGVALFYWMRVRADQGRKIGGTFAKIILVNSIFTSASFFLLLLSPIFVQFL